ncbi:MAG: hypothetical protein U1F30_07310 [Steroidobacteraceae bacterium]
MSRPALHLDFVAPAPQPRWPGAALLLAGIVTVAATAVAWQRTAATAAGMHLRVDARAANRHMALQQPSAELLGSAAAASRELAMPWGLMLSDLESAGKASASDVALLAVTPDSRTGRIAITAEARTLPLALGYLQQLQSRPAVHDAVLVAHELQVGAADRPVRIQISADWRRGT